MFGCSPRKLSIAMRASGSALHRRTGPTSGQLASTCAMSGCMPGVASIHARAFSFALRPAFQWMSRFGGEKRCHSSIVVNSRSPFRTVPTAGRTCEMELVTERPRQYVWNVSRSGFPLGASIAPRGPSARFRAAQFHRIVGQPPRGGGGLQGCPVGATARRGQDGSSPPGACRRAERARWALRGRDAPDAVQLERPFGMAGSGVGRSGLPTRWRPVSPPPPPCPPLGEGGRPRLPGRGMATGLEYRAVRPRARGGSDVVNLAARQGH